MTPIEYRQRALEKYGETGMRLANKVDLWWDALLGMRGAGTETHALNEIAPCIDDFRDACSDLARATQQVDRARTEQ